MDEVTVINIAEAPGRRHPRRSGIIDLEPESARWAQIGINVRVMEPGQPSGMYHSEVSQEDFLVLHGECIAIVDEVERPLRQWDLLHCPAGAAHVFVGAGDGPCAVLMIGARCEREIDYPVSEVAGRYGASAAAPTTSPDEAYAEWHREPWQPAGDLWPLP
ncbi:MAG TPA: cupin domain-containing protein [Solirubrobacteraceae bacterium]|nr:cupin domain-containing protein [Solirubrobacteraceae bacterium]